MKVVFLNENYSKWNSRHWPSLQLCSSFGCFQSHETYVKSLFRHCWSRILVPLPHVVEQLPQVPQSPQVAVNHKEHTLLWYNFEVIFHAFKTVFKSNMYGILIAWSVSIYNRLFRSETKILLLEYVLKTLDLSSSQHVPTNEETSWSRNDLG